MTPKEAIKQLDLQLGRFHPDLDPVPFNALKLGIKALERQREEEALAVWYFPRPLPGETEE